MSIRLTLLVFLTNQSGKSGQSKHSLRMCFSSFPGCSRVSVFVVIRFEDNHPPWRGLRVKITVSIGAGRGSGIGALRTVLLEMAVLDSNLAELWTPLESLLADKRRGRGPRAMTLGRVGLGDCQRVIGARTKKLVTTTVACVPTYLRATSALVMETKKGWPFLFWGGVALSRGRGMV